MWNDLPAVSIDPLGRDGRQVSRSLRHYQAGNLVRQGQIDSDTDVAVTAMQAGTYAAGTAMRDVTLVVKLEQDLEARVPAAADYLALLVGQHAWGMSDALARLQRRLNR